MRFFMKERRMPAFKYVSKFDSKKVDRGQKKKVLTYSPYQRKKSVFNVAKEQQPANEKKYANIVGKLVSYDENSQIGELIKAGTDKTWKFTIKRPMSVNPEIGSIIELKKCGLNWGNSVFCNGVKELSKASNVGKSAYFTEVPISIGWEKTDLDEAEVVNPILYVTAKPFEIADFISETPRIIKQLSLDKENNVSGCIVSGENHQGKKIQHIISFTGGDIDLMIANLIEKCLQHAVRGAHWCVFPVMKYDISKTQTEVAKKLSERLLANGELSSKSNFIVGNFAIYPRSNKVSYINASRENPTVFECPYPQDIKELSIIDYE